MGARLLNVRLDDARVRKARRLRERGITLSDLVREALDKRFEELEAPRGAADVGDRLRAIFDRFPDPPDLPPRAYDVHDRHEAREAVGRHIARRDARRRQ